MHVGAVEQRVTLGQQYHVAPGAQVRGDPLGGRDVEVLQGARVTPGWSVVSVVTGYTRCSSSWPGRRYGSAMPRAMLRPCRAL